MLLKIEKILNEVLNTFKLCNIRSFPIDCFEIARLHNFNVIKYSDLSKKKANACASLSEDACIIDKTIYYNDVQPNSRIRFSIMHELGHCILHSSSETDANRFASNILAPRIAIHYAECKNHVDVAKRFDISYEAAEYAFDDYRRWHRMAVYKMSILDKEMYQYFYNQELRKFVWNIGECTYCKKPIYNKPYKSVCPLCSTRHYMDTCLGNYEVPNNLQWYN